MGEHRHDCYYLWQYLYCYLVYHIQQGNPYNHLHHHQIDLLHLDQKMELLMTSLKRCCDFQLLDPRMLGREHGGSDLDHNKDNDSQLVLFKHHKDSPVYTLSMLMITHLCPFTQGRSRDRQEGYCRVRVASSQACNKRVDSSLLYMLVCVCICIYIFSRLPFYR